MLFSQAMEPLSQRIIKTIHIWIAAFLMLLAAAIFLFTHEKAAGYKLLVPYHNPTLDVVVSWFTYVGDGIFVLVCAVVLFVYKQKRLALIVVVSFLLSGLLVQIPKNLIDAARPALYFQGLGQPFHIIPDVTLTASHASFPSGHTATVFAFMSCLVLMFPKSKWNGVWLLVAIAVAYSRLFVGNHFLVDVLVGAIIGMFSTFLTYYVVFRTVQKKSIK